MKDFEIVSSEIDENDPHLKMVEKYEECLTRLSDEASKDEDEKWAYGEALRWHFASQLVHLTKEQIQLEFAHILEIIDTVKSEMSHEPGTRH